MAPSNKEDAVAPSNKEKAATEQEQHAVQQGMAAQTAPAAAEKDKAVLESARDERPALPPPNMGAGMRVDMAIDVCVYMYVFVEVPTPRTTQNSN